MRQRAALVVAMAPWLVAVADAAVCPRTGAEAPLVTTLMASKEHPATDAWTVSPSCAVTVSPLTQRAGTTTTTYLKLTDENIARIESLPTNTKALWFVGYKLARGADFSNATQLNEIFMGYSSIATVENLKLPHSLVIMDLQQNLIPSLAKLKLPASLTSLSVATNKLTSIDFAMPPKLEYLDLAGNPITRVENVTFPDSITWIDLSDTNISTVRGTRWPSGLTEVKFSTTPITTFEVRASDADVISKLKTFTAVVPPSTCADATAKPTVVGGKQLCVIADARFDAVYGTKTSPTAVPTTDASGSAGFDDSNSTALPPADNIKNPTGPTNAAADTLSPSPSGSVDTASSSHTLVIVIVLLGGVLAVVIGAIGYRHCVRQVPTTSSDEKYARHIDRSSTDRSVASDPISSANASLAQLRTDMRDGGRLAPFRIDERDVQLGRVLARGGFGVIYRGTYHNRPVAVKQLLPDSWRDNKILGRFADEIRLCTTLLHPKIVEFIGVSWTSFRDISVVIEFMEGGDLHGALRGQPGPCRDDWTDPWSTRKLQRKAGIARDVAEAIVYLHTLSSPILHRDLKAQNVLLDAHGHAKLSDFGISREIAIDETMTSEIGTMAWIAPEVLRGERYSDKADIYSFGVLLVELDRCRHPYAGVSAASGTDVMSFKGTQIAVLVSTGELRPSVSSECPSWIRSLVELCTAFDPATRPSATQVLETIQDIVAGERLSAFV